MTIAEWIAALALGLNAVGIPIARVVYTNLAGGIAAAGAEARLAQDRLADFKTEVARTYASTGYLKDVEDRVMAAINRIDGKLDVLTARPGHGD